MPNFFDRLRYWQQRVELANDEVHIVPYRGYGTLNDIFVSARILEYRDMRPHIADGAFRNMVNMYRRFESDEVPDCHLQLGLAEQTYTLKSDNEGYVNTNIHLKNPLQPIGQGQWFRTHWKLLESSIPLQNDHPITATGEILVPHGDVQYGIITDIDDTVMKTHVVSKTKMLYYTFFKNAYSRLAFLGAAPLYWAWRKGDTGKRANPIFYVSNSPCNLYDLLSDFMHHNDLPKGPILLRDIVLPNSAQVVAFKGHKYNTVVRILTTYPHLPFILVGDSGERDADIYTEIASIFPNQVKAIYIRTVNDSQRNERVRRVLERCESCETLLFDDSTVVIRHSANAGHVQERWVAAVQSAMQHAKHAAIWEDWTDES